MLVYCVTEPGLKIERGIPINALITYYGMTNKATPLSSIRESRGWQNLLLDCGAFAADNAGVAIDIDAYSRYVKENAGAIDYYVALDIRGKLRESFDNLEYMKREYGLKPGPVGHPGQAQGVVRQPGVHETGVRPQAGAGVSDHEWRS